MIGSIDDYYDFVQKPWGKMFYDLIYLQLNIPETPRLRILDFGSGFGICADYYARFHDVVAVEPNLDMLKHRFHENEYTQLQGGVEVLDRFEDEFDLILCHNVLEFAENKQEIFNKISSVLKLNGKLSVVKHTVCGKIMHQAVFHENPGEACILLDDEIGGQNTLFGDRELYSHNDILVMSSENYLLLNYQYAIRSFYALTQNNEVKFDKEWYEKMLELEMKVCNIDTFKNIAFFNHYIFHKFNLRTDDIVL